MAVPQASVPFTLLLGVLLALTALGMDLFLPSVPVIAQSFGAEPGVAQHAITTYLLGLAIGQLAWGPVSDRYGRKPALLAGAFDGTTRPMALAIAGFGVAALLAERLYFRKMVHG